MKNYLIKNQLVDFTQLINENENLERISIAKSHRTHWAAILTNYKKAHEVERHFIDFEDCVISIRDLKINDIIQLQRIKRNSGRYAYKSDLYITIKNITEFEIEFEVSNTITKAFRQIYLQETSLRT